MVPIFTKQFINQGPAAYKIKSRFEEKTVIK